MDPRSLAALVERSQLDLFWIPADAVIHDRPELFYLSCPRDIRHLNCVLRTHAEPERLPALIAEVDTAHREVCSRWVVPGTMERAPLERALSQYNYSLAQEHHTHVVDAVGFVSTRKSDARVERVSDARSLEDCVQIAGEAFEEAVPGAAALADQLRQCASPGGRVHRFVAYDSAGEPVSSGSMTIFPQLEFGFLWGGATRARARGLGHYSAVVAARVAMAREHGLRWVGVNALIGTSSPIIAKQGFEQVGTMAYWHRQAT